ncbi:MAG TPA: AAA family ATPase [Gaiellaceae bacterium]|nr:AAA family ATPase [Gaiellaceae bacterium]
MLVGRSAETATIDRLLAQARSGLSGVLVVRGEAGAGKSTLLEYAVESAEGFTVLRGVGIESEAELAFAGLHQIVRPVLDRLERLPDPQASALRSAFALSAEQVDERFPVSLGVLQLLSEVAEEQALLCVVDDAQWLDQASVDALVFAARRLDAERLVLLFAARDDPERMFAAPGLPVLRLAPLGTEDARALLVDRHGDEIGSEALDWLLATANGNPLALIELPASLASEQLSGQEALDGRMAPPTSVEQAYLGRVQRLPSQARSLLLVAACEESGDRAAVTRAAAELGLDLDGLSLAETEGLVDVGRDRIDFRHPLMRSAVYRGAGFAERERAHRALAAVLTDPGDADRRAWHRAAATVGTDDEVAAELEHTAERARLRGGHGAAAAALERAAELTPEAEGQGRRLVTAARGAWHAGRPEPARALLDRASPLVTDPLTRAELDHVRGEIEFRCGSLLDAAAILLDGSDAVARVDPGKACQMLLDAASVAAKIGDVSRLGEISRRVAVLPRGGDEPEALRIDLVVGVGGLIEGKTEKIPLIERSVARAEAFDDPRLLSWAAMGASALGDSATEAAHLRHAVAVARDSRAVDTLVFVLENVVNSAMLAGRYGIESEATEGLRLARDAGLSNAATAHLAALAWVAGLQGRERDCRTYAAAAVEAARANGLANANTAAEWGLALLDLGNGRPEDAAARLAELRSAARGLAHPLLVLTSTPDLVEASVRAGREEDARMAFAPLEAFAQPDAPPWTIALAARCRGLLSQGDEAERWFLEALRLHAEGNRPFDRARTELVYGEFLRRGRRRIDAREQLRAALAGFEQFRAEPWAERARTELRATGETARKRDPSTIDQLTPQELQIAQLVGEGLSNKDVAAQLFLSPRTVEYHLRKVFAKLGIASRSELIRQGVGDARRDAAAVP